MLIMVTMFLITVVVGLALTMMAMMMTFLNPLAQSCSYTVRSDRRSGVAVGWTGAGLPACLPACRLRDSGMGWGGIRWDGMGWHGTGWDGATTWPSQLCSPVKRPK